MPDIDVCYSNNYRKKYAFLKLSKFHFMIRNNLSTDIFPCKFDIFFIKIIEQ